jgi:erythromycin esterase-like protein
MFWQSISALSLLVPLSLTAQAQTPAQTPAKPTFEEALLASRSPIVLADGRFTGAGAAVLDTAVQSARFVLLGETHFTREIPKFAEALCDTMHPDAYAVEAGPYAGRFVNGLLAKQDRIPQMAARDREFPDNMAFLDMRPENDLAAHCAASSHNPHFALWGLDQEYLGSAGTLLQSMAATNPGPLSRAAISKAQDEEAASAGDARSTGDFSKLFMIASTDAEVQALQSAIDKDGTSAARDELHEFTLSRQIYRLNYQGSHASSLVRAELLKQHFLADYLPFKQANPSARILFKLGDNHTGKGFNDTHELNLGNFIAELAAADQVQSLHLQVLGVRGKLYVVTGYAKPLGEAPFDLSNDPDVRWIAKAVADLLPQQKGSQGTVLTLFDLRQLRYRDLDLSPEWEHEIYSNDILVLIPELSVAKPIQ